MSVTKIVCEKSRNFNHGNIAVCLANAQIFSLTYFKSGSNSLFDLRLFYEQGKKQRNRKKQIN
jgi:hypothetical protein